MRRLAGALLVLAASLAWSGRAFEQKPPAQTPTFRASTIYVHTQVQARDASGRNVPGLSVKDFEVFEDGVRQTVTSFAAMVAGRAITDIEAAPAVREGLITPPRVRAPPEGRIFIIFIDDLHVQFRDTARLKDYLRKIRDTVLHENDLVGIVSSGYSSIAFDLSPDPNHVRLNIAIDKVSGAGKDPREIINSAQTISGPVGLRHDTYVALQLAYEILKQAEQVPNRRKAFIWLSSGYDFNPFVDARYQALRDQIGGPPSPIDSGRPTGGSGQGGAAAEIARNPFEMNGLQFSSADLMAAIGELVTWATRAGVQIWPVDPRGLVAGPDVSDNLSTAEFTDFVNTTLSTLQVIAEGTGAECICQVNDPTAGLRKLDNAMSDYYVVGYESTNPDPLKKTRRVEIKVRNATVKTVVYKDRYSIKR